MQAPLYDEIHGLTLDIVNASASGDEERVVEAYDELKELCDSHCGQAFDHPLQWEALGDFSDNMDAAISAYEKGLECASRLDLSEYTASIKFAMAESYCEQGDLVEARRLVEEAKAEADNTAASELQVAIDAFRRELDHP